MKTAEQIREKWLYNFGLSVSKDKEIGKKITQSALGAMEEYADQFKIEKPTDEEIVKKLNEISNDGKPRTQNEIAIELVTWFFKRK